MSWYKVRDTDTQEAVLEFEKRTGLKVVSARKYKGSMKWYLGITIKGNEADYERYFKSHMIKDLKLTFCNRFKDGEEFTINLDVDKREFKEVNWILQNEVLKESESRI